jgi:hypothetical protein
VALVLVLTLEVRLILAALATYRVSHALALEKGPFAVCERLRGWVSDHFGAASWVFEGLTCPLCLSVWVVWPFIVVVVFPTPVGDLGLMWLGLSGVASFLYKVER